MGSRRDHDDSFADEFRDDFRDEFRHHDAAYVLGALSSDDRRAFEAHLAGCTECAAAVRDLAGLPGLLTTVPKAVAEAGPVEAPPATLLPALVRQARREGRRRRWTVGLVAAASAVTIALAGLPLLGRGEDPTTAQTPGPTPTATVAERAMSAVAPSDVEARVALVGVAWGTRIEVTCSYADAGEYAAGPADAAYVLVVRDRAGREEEVAHWRGLPGRTMRVQGASAFSVGEIASIELRSAEGTPLLELRS